VHALSLTDITEVKIVANVNRHNYPGHDYDDAENDRPIERPSYSVELKMQSGNTLTVWGYGEGGTIQLADAMAEFLGITLTTT
jgi:hypothetical protein